MTEQQTFSIEYVDYPGTTFSFLRFPGTAEPAHVSYSVTITEGKINHVAILKRDGVGFWKIVNGKTLPSWISVIESRFASSIVLNGDV